MALSSGLVTAARRSPSMSPLSRLSAPPSLLFLPFSPRLPSLRLRRRTAELAGVEHLDGQASADLHLPGVVGGIGAEPAAGRPVPHRVGTVLDDDVLGRDDVALGLGHLLALGVEDPAADGGVRQGTLSCSKWARTTVAKSQVRMMSWPWGRRSMGKSRSKSSGVVAPADGDLRRERRRGPGVHDVGVADEAAGLAALGLVVPARRLGRRVDGQARTRRARWGWRSPARPARRAGTRRGSAHRRTAGG